MKKFLAIVMALAIVMTICACGVSADTPANDERELITIDLPEREENESNRDYFARIDTIKPRNGKVSRGKDYITHKCVGYVEYQNEENDKVTFDVYVYIDDGLLGVGIKNSHGQEISFYGYTLESIGQYDVKIRDVGKPEMVLYIHPDWSMDGKLFSVVGSYDE